MEPTLLNNSSTAAKVGGQLYREAAKKAYETGHLDKTKEIAIAMANQYHSNILRAIDEETRFQSAKNVW